MGILAWVTGGSVRRAGRFLLAGSRLRAGAVLAGLVLLGASVPASAQTLTWSVVPSPSPTGHYNDLHGVSCASAAACTAVGSYATSNGAYATLVESWNGTSWSVVPSPSRGSGGNVLDGVSCVSAAACTAVGAHGAGSASRTLVESWNGTSWSVVPSPNPGSEGSFLHGVSCVSAAACTAVGSYTTSSAIGTLVESWNGTSWSVVPSPNYGSEPNVLDGVSCVSAAACTAVGYYVTRSVGGSKTLVESWNGTSWSVVPNPSPAGRYNDLDGVSCVSAAACTAVGYHTTSSGRIYRTLVESWNGTSWSVVPSPSRGSGGSYLDGVSCVSAAACTAVGYGAGSSGGAYRTLVESWNGTSWSVVPSPSRGSGGSYLDGVSCASAACTAAGYYASSNGGDRTLIESGTAASR